MRAAAFSAAPSHLQTGGAALPPTRAKSPAATATPGRRAPFSAHLPTSNCSDACTAAYSRRTAGAIFIWPERKHLGAGHAAVEIRRQDLLISAHVMASPRLLCHCANPGFLRLTAFACRRWREPESQLRTHFLDVLRQSLPQRIAPRVIRDFTVPSEICKSSAISSYDISSRSRRIIAVR